MSTRFTNQLPFWPCARFTPRLKHLAILALFCLSAAVATAQPTGFTDVQIGDNWNAAVGLTFSKDGNRMYVWEKGGRVWLVENGQKLSTPFLNISEEVGDWKDHGMLGFALDPNFESNGYVYVLYAVDRHHLLYFGTGSYNPAANEYFNASIGRLTRYTARTSDGKKTVDPASRKILIGETKSTGLPILYTGHGVGSLVFGEDGSLLLSIGDGGSAGYVDKGYDPANPNDTYVPQAIQDGIITSKENIGAFRAQQINCLNGKILRVDPATGNGLPSNPYYNAAAPRSPASRVWALGFRNAFRFTVKPGTGNANFPGVLYVGDVGWYNWEEIDVVTQPGQNFGWPIYEGLTQQEWYYHVQVPNTYAPQNPLYGKGNCTQQYFYYGDLIRQPQKTTAPYFGNPCNYNVPISGDTYNLFVHSRPAFDWWHKEKGTATRTGIFSGENAATVLVGASGSPVTGPQFTGSSVTGGVWYNGDDFPAAYKNTYFFGDYVDGWINSSKFDNSHNPQSIETFIGQDAHVVAMATNPVSGGLYYINYAYQLRKVSYNATNSPPKAVASADKLFGQSPLTVQFTGSNSTDPEGKPLTYDWNFGDGSAHSTQANPSHTFTATGRVDFTVTLKVTDAGGATATATLVIALNNTPPTVKITSPAAGTKYPMTENKEYALTANVADAETENTLLKYEWQTVLHHNSHTHPEPIDTNPTTTTTITPIGCDGEVYFYRISLKVTDPEGLAGTDYVDLYPDCGGVVIKPVSITSPTAGQSFAAGSNINLSVSFAEVARSWAKVAYYQGTVKIAEATAAPFSAVWYNVAGGNYSLKAIATDTDNHTVESDLVPISVTGTTPPPPTATGKITREYWANLTGYGTSSIPVNTTPTSVTEPTLFEGPSNIGDNYGTRFRGYITAPVTGEYTFWIAGDNNSDLLLGTSQDPASKRLIANVNGWTNPREWGKYATQQSAKVSLVAGQKYYIEALHKEEAGGDHVAVGWQLPDGTLERPIPGNRLSPFSGGSTPPPTNQPPAVSVSSPANGANYTLGQSITFAATASDADSTVAKVEFMANGVKVGEDATSPYSISWVPATAATYILAAKATDNSGASTTSNTVSITVTGTTTPPPTASGSISREVWTNLTGYGTGSIPLASPPSSSGVLTLFETPADIGDNYGQRIRGYVTAPATGEYTFWIAGDNNSDLLLGTSQDPASKRLVANVNGWTNPREWGKYASQQSAKVSLVAGQKYYIEALHKEEAGGDHVAVGWQLPDGTLERPIPGGRLSPFSGGSTPPPANQPPAVSVSSPSNGSTYTLGQSISISATASDTDGGIAKVEFLVNGSKVGEDGTSPYSFAWTPSAAATYTLTARATDNAGATATSAAASVTVTSSTAKLYRILPLGNSITQGTNTSQSYRYPLWKKLIDANYNFDMIGSQNTNYTGNPSWPDYKNRTFDRDHEGHWGWRTDNILNGTSTGSTDKLASWLIGYTPDIVLLHLGTNDMFQNQSVTETIGELREVVRQLRLDNPNVAVLMAKLIPAYAPVVGTTSANNITLLNNAIPALVQELHTSQSPVILVDQASGFDPTTGVDTYDGIHPNASGEEKMAAKWMGAITAVITGNTPVPPPTASGSISREVWTNLTGYGTGSIPLASPPSSSGVLTLFETPADIGDNYGQRIRGYVTAPATGEYTFWVAGDNNSDLLLGTSSDPSTKRLVANVNGWTNPREWGKYASQQSAKVSLVAGQKYYIEALHKEEAGGDHVAVGWQLPDGTLERPIPGNRLSPFVAAATLQGITGLNPDEDIVAYPNPFNNQIIVAPKEQLKIKRIELFDLAGKRLQVQESGLKAEDGRYTFQITKELKRGVYLLRVTDQENNLRSIKVMKD